MVNASAGRENYSGNLSYRPDIDGLRAVAVLAVVFNHVGFSIFSGGFVGVDIFFVISGYLITGIILGQVSQGAFSFREFYIRRARRILPAFYFVLLMVVLVGYFVYLPSDYYQVSQSALSAILFSANIFFWKNSGGYFSPSAEEMPLLHIWSLSVEEQFYFIWPVMLLLLLRIRSAFISFLFVFLVALLSFLLSEAGVIKGWSGTYYLLPFRASELLVGALLAIWGYYWPVRKRSEVAANILSGSGVILVFASIFLLDEGSSFPGVNALIPCIGAALIIAGPLFGRAVFSRILAVRPLVFIGLISYSLYLWHWPLISMLHYMRIQFTVYVMLGLVCSSMLLGYLSWRYIERVYRLTGTGNAVAVRGFKHLTVAGILIVLLAPVFVYVKDGLPERFPFALLTQEQLMNERQRYWGGIKTKSTNFNTAAAVKKVLVVGNSFAYDLSYALTENNFSGQVKLIETTHHCFNFGGSAASQEKKEFCSQRLDIVLESKELKLADAIYLHDNWGGKDLSSLDSVLLRIRGVTNAPIYVFGPKMVYTSSVMNISMLAQKERNISISSINSFAKSFQNDRVRDYDLELAEFFSSKHYDGVKYVSSLRVQCGDGRTCGILSDEGKYLYFDSGHFTLEGARLFGQRLRMEHEYLF